MTFGDHATFIMGGEGNISGANVGGQGSHGPGGTGPDTKPAPARPGARRRGGKLVAVSTVLGTIFTAGAFFIAVPAFLRNGEKAAPQTVAGPATTTAPALGTGAPAPAQAAAGSGTPTTEASDGGAPPTVFDDVVTLDSKTGVDLDAGNSKKLYRQTADADLYLDWGYVLYSSARHPATYDDSGSGTQEGAYARCRTYRLADKTTANHLTIGGGNQQHCFTTSAGHPAWFVAINQVADGGLLVKVVVWRE